MQLYFGSLFATLTTALVAAMIIFIVLAVKNRDKITKWGRLIALFLAVGLAVSIVSAVRDNYAAPDALFSMTSFQSNACSILGYAIFITAFVSIFFKNQTYKRRCFYIMAAFFIAQVAIIEASRLMIG